MSVTMLTLACNAGIKDTTVRPDEGSMEHLNLRSLSALALLLSLAACGGGDPSDATDPTQASGDADSRSASALAISGSTRISAATATAKSSTNDCAAIRPFYWEIGDRDARLASGSINSDTTTTKYTATTRMSIASASKWIYGAFVAQRAKGNLTDLDRKFLSMRAGYVSMSYCVPGQTVDGCLNYQGNGTYTPGSDGTFYYNGGHMQEHASLIGLGSMSSKALTAEVKSQLGADLQLAYSYPQIAGGVVASADAYARFLRKMLSGELYLGRMLGSGAVCTNALTCKSSGIEVSPSPMSESWHYSIGHWVEDDPEVGDGAFSSAGAMGFYPWIDAGKTSYGIVARKAEAGSGEASAMCGRLIRKAWATGQSL
jgi:hypothetical protein